LKRLLLDQGCPRSTALILKSEAWDVLHVGDIGLNRASDAEILDRARVDARACVTLDADFHTILAVSGAKGPSTIRVRIEGLNAAALAELILRIWPDIEADVEEGAMVMVDSSSVRVRKLPVR
jgi:predicted nuclease of predicted toxin-antitoxin system